MRKEHVVFESKDSWILTNNVIAFYTFIIVILYVACVTPWVLKPVVQLKVVG